MNSNNNSTLNKTQHKLIYVELNILYGLSHIYLHSVYLYLSTLFLSVLFCIRIYKLTIYLRLRHISTDYTKYISLFIIIPVHQVSSYMQG